jgi:hypothetical protein
MRAATTHHYEAYEEPTALPDQALTLHAQQRMAARSFSPEAVTAVLAFGRSIHTRGAEIRVIGRKEVAQYRSQGVDLRAFEGVQLVCASDGVIITMYRNRDFRRLRPHRRSRRCEAKWTKVLPSATCEASAPDYRDNTPKH